MKPGQWIGVSSGDRNGLALIDLDEYSANRVGGFAYVYFDDGLSSAARIPPIRVEEADTIEVQLSHFNPQSGEAFSTFEANQFNDGFQYPETASLKLKLIAQDRASFSWSTRTPTVEGVYTFGKGEVELYEPPELSTQKFESISWDQFKSQVGASADRDLIYRGQSRPFSLRTSFHRTKRKCLQRYLDEDMPELHRATSSHTSHVFRMEIADEKGALLALAQHHGYPTPLLDWSRSPFVAAFFAFEAAKDDSVSTEPVRIYQLDKAVLSETGSLPILTYVRPHISILETLAVDNTRLIPQQGLLTLTNVDDIELFLQNRSKQMGVRLLHGFDVEYGDRKKALAELRLMGITRAMLFPGFDGICSTLRERRF